MKDKKFRHEDLLRSLPEFSAERGRAIAELAARDIRLPYFRVFDSEDLAPYLKGEMSDEEFYNKVLDQMKKIAEVYEKSKK